MATTSNPAEFAAGAVFGSALYYAGVFNPNTILSQMRLASWDMMQVMLGASATSALVIHLAARANYAPKKPRAPARLFGWFPYDGNVVGGALVGLGMAVSGACPGTVLVQFGQGVPRSGFAMLGCLLGAAVYQKAVMPVIQRSKPLTSKPASPKPSAASPPTLHAALNLPEQTLLAIWVALCALGLVLLRPLRNPAATDPVLGGLGVGLAQTATLLLARHPIGVSGAYGDLTNLLFNLLPSSSSNSSSSGGKPARKSLAAGITPSIAFAAGVLGISALLPNVIGAAPAVDVGAARALLGGVSMVLGARIGGGCTSGHGISGMASFATASAITTAAMFGAGIAGAAALGAVGL